MTELEIAIISATLNIAPALIMRAVAAKMPRDEAIAMLDAEYLAVEEAARELERQKFSVAPDPFPAKP